MLLTKFHSDMIDTEPSKGGDIYKMLLGSLDPTYDYLDNPEYEATRSYSDDHSTSAVVGAASISTPPSTNPSAMGSPPPIPVASPLDIPPPALHQSLHGGQSPPNADVGNPSPRQPCSYNPTTSSEAAPPSRQRSHTSRSQDPYPGPQHTKTWDTIRSDIVPQDQEFQHKMQ